MSASKLHPEINSLTKQKVNMHHSSSLMFTLVIIHAFRGNAAFTYVFLCKLQPNQTAVNIYKPVLFVTCRLKTLFTERCWLFWCIWDYHNLIHIHIIILHLLMRLVEEGQRCIARRQLKIFTSNIDLLGIFFITSAPAVILAKERKYLSLKTDLICRATWTRWHICLGL